MYVICFSILKLNRFVKNNTHIAVLLPNDNL